MRQENAKTHIFRAEMQYAGERQLLADLVAPGMKALDVGTAATGRSAHILRDLGCEVVSVEINVAAIREYARNVERPDILVAAADLCKLPFREDSFDLVLVAFHGLDYLLTKADRKQAFQEVDRVLTPSGNFAFNAFNRLGLILTPSSVLSLRDLRRRANHLLRGRLFTPTFIDQYNLEMHQASPRSIIRQVEAAATLRFAYAVNLSGTTRNLGLLTLFASAPYYVFVR